MFRTPSRFLVWVENGPAPFYIRFDQEQSFITTLTPEDVIELITKLTDALMSRLSPEQFKALTTEMMKVRQ